MKKLALLLGILICFAELSGQTLKDKVTGQVQTGVAYYFDFVNMEPAEEGNTKLDVFIQVPFNRIKFIRDMEGFTAEYNMTVTIYENEDEIFQEKSWVEKVNVIGFRETMSQKNFNISRKSFYLKPGQYTAKLNMEDRDSKQNFPGEVKITVRDLKNSFVLSDPVLVNPPVSEGNKLLPNVSHIILTKDSSVPFYFQATEIRELKKGKNQIFQKFDSTHVAVGECKLIIRLKSPDNKEIFECHRQIIVRLSGLPMIIKDLDKAIEQLTYIASGHEMDSIRQGDGYEEKLKLFMDFWKKRDKNEATEENEIFTEYYTRVEYANKNFTHYMDGWKTDMGMVLIYLGLPSNIDRHPFDYDSKPYEVWEYYELNKRFVFVDYTGFGDYRLMTPFPGELYRFQ
ncbi:MAG: GWxTD domain-containing protein [Ignavibacteriales bacterium]|nr:GWxTD domain-containing protein [Ignavibacteriales bacterium]